MSSSESELSPSPSPPPSPGATLHYQGPPSLESLVVHFVDAKRSLNATSHVYRANELVTNSRALIEEIAILNAKNTYARRGLDEQVDTLDAIKDALTDDGHKISDEFDATIAQLDKAHIRLDKTLTLLKKTVVKARSQQDPSRAENEDVKEAESKTLFDFVDEETHNTLLTSLRGLIDQYHDARSELSTDLSTFNSSLRSIAEKLSDSQEDTISDPEDKHTIYDEPSPSIPTLFHNMEEHATEMASLLENLVNHYDLCVSALKHTEGGGEAAKAAVQQATDITTKSTTTGNEDDDAGQEESLYAKTAPEPISPEELTEMLHILSKDSLEVEDVVIEIRDRASEFESQYSLLSSQARKTRLRNKNLRQVLDMMHAIRSAIPHHLSAASHFRETWTTHIRAKMEAKTTELAELSGFYEQFLAGYGKLLKEVERRKGSESAAKRIADRARKELEKLSDADARAREEFMEEVGVYLPRDLGVWHGLEEDGTRWEVKPVYHDHDEEEDAEQSPRLLDGS